MLYTSSIPAPFSLYIFADTIACDDPLLLLDEYPVSKFRLPEPNGVHTQLALQSAAEPAALQQLASVAGVSTRESNLHPPTVGP
jgi:hypothetical protein